MNDMRIAIACKDDNLRKLAYVLFPAHDPANLLNFSVVEDLIQAMNHGRFDVVILDEGLEDRGRDFTPMVELARARMPVVALMPRAPSFAEPASAEFERTAVATRSVGLKDSPRPRLSLGASVEIVVPEGWTAVQRRSPS